MAVAFTREGAQKIAAATRAVLGGKAPGGSTGAFTRRQLPLRWVMVKPKTVGGILVDDDKAKLCARPGPANLASNPADAYAAAGGTEIAAADVRRNGPLSAGWVPPGWWFLAQWIAWNADDVEPEDEEAPTGPAPPTAWYRISPGWTFVQGSAYAEGKLQLANGLKIDNVVAPWSIDEPIWDGRTTTAAWNDLDQRWVIVGQQCEAPGY